MQSLDGTNATPRNLRSTIYLQSRKAVQSAALFKVTPYGRWLQGTTVVGVVEPVLELADQHRRGGGGQGHAGDLAR